MSDGISIPAVRPKVSVIVPARNEEANLERCLRSIVLQRGVCFEVIVVDDHSTDRTREIAVQVSRMEKYPVAGLQQYLSRMLVMDARSPLPPDWTGKANALWSAASQATGEWLLFTDADTVHAPGSLAASLREAETLGAGMLSLSPEQEVEGFWQRALMPVVFAELASTYRPRDVCDPAKPAAAAANGQYLLVRREVYGQVGGHAAVACDLLEDVALARLVKQAGHVLRFRLGAGLVRTRMYRGFREMQQGWTKNLVLLFPMARQLAALRLAEFVLLAALPIAASSTLAAGRYWTFSATALCGSVVWVSFLLRIRRAHFGVFSTALAFFGLPVFALLLLLSRAAHRAGRVAWKGRNYSGLSAAGKQLRRVSLERVPGPSAVEAQPLPPSRGAR